MTVIQASLNFNLYGILAPVTGAVLYIRSSSVEVRVCEGVAARIFGALLIVLLVPAP